ncbi:hypothetical protein J7E91_21625 [Streptomyces sp. ISL-99]|uniref:hypothetical protein n=1 Tax=Streptomyces sp. ISL-99 TaxID=2819193 RepID=UPI001BE8CC42|nr:hypothetical protein [Streptomyces sp. ISL-99]MBT2527948.1 hypothetical protein [Streptomyces sp. ISL-99]
MDTHRAGLYPDVAAPGGLVAAMKEAARLRGCDIGPVSPTPDGVAIETARGYVSVDPAVEERLFRMGIRIPGYDWAIGSTDDLGLLVEAVAAWRQGMSFDELEGGFQFLELDEFTRALESGEPTSSQWSDLLSTDFYRRQWNLLRRFHADETLRCFFPTVSHGAVRLQVDRLDGVSRQVLVAELEGERYEVVRVGEPGATWVEVPSADLIACLRAFLTEQ